MRLVTILIGESVRIPLLIIEHAAIQEAVGLRFLANVDIGHDEVVALAEGLLRLQLRRLIPLARAQVEASVGKYDRGVRWVCSNQRVFGGDRGNVLDRCVSGDARIWLP